MTIVVDWDGKQHSNKQANKFPVSVHFFAKCLVREQTLEQFPYEGEQQIFPEHE